MALQAGESRPRQSTSFVERSNTLVGGKEIGENTREFRRCSLAVKKAPVAL